MAATPWATVEDVAEYNGTVVTPSQLRQAVTTLELHTGLIQDVERPDMSNRDRYWLKVATCLQAIWLIANPDLYERLDVSSASQDGQSASYNPDALTLAPLARRALKKLSWRGMRTMMVSGNGPRAYNVNSEEYDDSLAWKPL